MQFDWLKNFKLKSLDRLVRGKAIFQMVWVVLRVRGGDLEGDAEWDSKGDFR